MENFLKNLYFYSKKKKKGTHDRVEKKYKRKVDRVFAITDSWSTTRPLCNNLIYF
jgi:hypothetical protein